MDLATRLLAYLRTAIGGPRLEFVEHPERVTGGFDTRIFGFRLESAPPSFSGPLILRLLGTHHDPVRVLREQATQNALVDLGYPAPRALLATTDAEPLGGPFIVMERLPGVTDESLSVLRRLVRLAVAPRVLADWAP